MKELINVSFRAYQQIQNFSVKHPLDAIIELLTNSYDAYRRLEGQKKILINLYIDENKKEYLEVVDNATGVSIDRMKTNFLTVGNRTKVYNESRGFFSTGAKNISALGNVHFTSFNNNLISRVTIDQEGYGIIDTCDVDGNIIGIPQNELYNEMFGIKENGLSVMIELTENFYFNNQNNIINFLDTIPRVATIRNIANDDNVMLYAKIIKGSPIKDINNLNIELINNNKITFEKRLQYKYPEGKLLKEIEYIVPKYPEYKAKFVVYKTDKPISQPDKEMCMEFGFLIKDSSAVHEVTTLGDGNKYRWNPHINNLYGYIHCDGISDLLNKYDEQSTTEKFRNPSPVVDPIRITGTNKKHPFIISLLDIPKKELDDIIVNMENATSLKTINYVQFDSMAKEFEKMGYDFFSKVQGDVGKASNKDVITSFQETNDSKRIIAIETNREKYVLSEVDNQNLLLVDQVEDYVYDDEDKIIVDQILNYEEYDSNHDHVFIFSDDEKLIPLSKDIDIIYYIQQNVKVNKKPYIYTLSDKKKVGKTYIYKKGVVEKNKKTEIGIKKKSSFGIDFVSNPNNPKRYTIDTTNGILIKINLANPIVKDHLGSDATVNLGGDLSIKSNYFVRNLMCDIFADIILDNDIKTNKLSISANMMQTDIVNKINEYRKEIISRIEHILFKMFDKQINTKKQSLIEAVKQHINDNIELFTSTNQLNDLYTTNNVDSSNMQNDEFNVNDYNINNIENSMRTSNTITSLSFYDNINSNTNNNLNINYDDIAKNIVNNIMGI